MRKKEFTQWLSTVKGMAAGTISSRVSNVLRINKSEGDLDKHYENDRGRSLLSRFTYSKKDYDEKRPLRHNIIIRGNTVNGTATLKGEVELYFEFYNHYHKENSNGTELEVQNKKSSKQHLEEYKGVNNGTVDSYDCFLKRFNIVKSDFYKFGLDETIYPSDEKIQEYWNKLKQRVFNNEKVYIRGYGRDAIGTSLYKEFHVKVFGNGNIEKDPTNNAIPRKLIQILTGLRCNDNLLNYQVSHIFGMTRNALMFEAPWNIALVPKIIDPLTGHESNGNWPKEYQELFYKEVYKKYAKYIEEYNEIANAYNFKNEIEKFVLEKALNISSGYTTLKKQKKLASDLGNDFRLL